ncbi:MAG: hypothetical protein EI684_03595 [Candidatus Viridilinea halotolerans]|uniref:Sulfatase-modifying factor enzyme-like domain-containing protein n=1 Tax=Candidatus Viridilinea halotolerans TaxID=2491704 RepID=A0A426U7R1_9CHLR|nr:MAG: hypothetical protein EI684_03595 [Candidatus Viridilinea halotolerans]
MKHNPFTRSGALRLDHPLFRGRVRELAQLEQACLSDRDFFMLVYGGRQNGKTTVLLRLEASLKTRLGDGVRVCRVDFQRLPSATSPAVYRHLAHSIARVLPHAPAPPATPDAPTLGDFLEHALANPGVQRLAVILDELGTLPDTTREDLAHVLRALHTQRLASPALAKAQFVLAGGIELYRLAVVEASALRNVCEIVRLADLDEADAVAVIADGLSLAGVAPANARALGASVYSRVSGHPYFTQRLGEQLATQQLTGDEPDEAAVEAFTWALLEQDDPLLEHLRRSIHELHLEDGVRRLLSAAQRTSRTDDATERLDLLGLARRAERYWVPRSPLLTVALAEWLGMSLPLGTPMPVVAEHVCTLAMQQHLHDLNLEREALVSHLARASSSTEQVRLQRRANALADEIARIETLPRTAPPTVPAPLQAASPPQEDATPPVAPSQAAQPVPTRLSPLASRLIPPLVHIPAGPFLMGSNGLVSDDEKPQNTLTLPDYWIGRTPITNAQFRSFVEGDGYTNRAYWTEVGWAWREKWQVSQPRYWANAKWNGDDYPVVGVSWFEAVAYCRWLSAMTGHEFRLPSEAEWEKAARGPDGRIWPWGNTWEAGRCNSEEAGIKRSAPVGHYPNGASPYGVLDMTGNGWEWCATKWGKSYPYRLEDEWAEEYLEEGADRCFRGGAFWWNRQGVRGAFPHLISPRVRLNVSGLRVVSHAPVVGSDE